jgi:hypothetical protein
MSAVADVEVGVGADADPRVLASERVAVRRGADGDADAGGVTAALAALIARNPGCLLIVNGRSWRVEKGEPCPAGFERWPREAVDLWYRAQTLCRSEDVAALAEGAEGFGHCMGLDLLKALAVLQGVRVESV